MEEIRRMPRIGPNPIIHPIHLKKWKGVCATFPEDQKGHPQKHPLQNHAGYRPLPLYNMPHLEDIIAVSHTIFSPEMKSFVGKKIHELFISLKRKSTNSDK